jgi:hypothetical protein
MSLYSDESSDECWSATIHRYYIAKSLKAIVKLLAMSRLGGFKENCFVRYAETILLSEEILLYNLLCAACSPQLDS